MTGHGARADGLPLGGGFRVGVNGIAPAAPDPGFPLAPGDEPAVLPADAESDNDNARGSHRAGGARW
jgi:hypothetical protein